MQSKGLTTVAVVAVIALTAFAALAYLLYTIPQSNADSLNRQVAKLRVQETRMASRLAVANRRASSAEARAASAGGLAKTAFAKGLAKGHAKGLADAAAKSQAKYAAGYAAGNSAAFGQYGGNWASGTAYLVLVRPGAGGSYQIAARAALRECQAVYAQNGSVYVQGPAC